MAHVLEKKQSFSIDSEEFQKAVQEAASKAVSEAVIAALSNAKGKSDSEQIGKSIACELAKLTGASDGKIYVDPELTQQRLIAKKELNEMINQARQKFNATQDERDMPLYRVVANTFLGGKMIYPSIIGQDRKYIPKLIGWLYEPNAAMVPVNSLGRKIYDKYKEYIGDHRDPVPKEDIWVNDQGISKFGKNPNDMNKVLPTNDNPYFVEISNDTSQMNKNSYLIPNQTDVGLAFIN